VLVYILLTSLGWRFGLCLVYGLGVEPSPQGDDFDAKIARVPINLEIKQITMEENGVMAEECQQLHNTTHKKQKRNISMLNQIQ
jgi:hypothetical protein